MWTSCKCVFPGGRRGVREGKRRLGRPSRFLQVAGGLLGTNLKASGEFVGTPTVRWLRQQTSTGEALHFTPIEGATELEYAPNADDVGACLRVECVGPYGGTPVTVDTAPIALDPSTYDELEGLLRRGHAEFNASTQQQVVRPTPTRRARPAHPHTHGRGAKACWLAARPLNRPRRVPGTRRSHGSCWSRAKTSRCEPSCLG